MPWWLRPGVLLCRKAEGDDRAGIARDCVAGAGQSPVLTRVTVDDRGPGEVRVHMRKSGVRQADLVAVRG